MKSKPKKLGLFMLIALVCGNMIGSGVFLLPSSLAALGSISLWSWAVTGFGALILALLFAKMSILVPYSGGPFAREIFSLSILQINLSHNQIQ